MITRGRKWWAALAVAAMASVAAGAGFDDFDSYADGTDLVNNGNGQFTYLPLAFTSVPIGPPSTLTAEAEGTAPSAPNVMQFADNGPVFVGWRARLSPASAIDMTPTGSTAKIEFDFKTISGPGGRISMSVRPAWSVDANAGAEDWINNPHTSGISDGGLYFLDNGNVLGALNNRYQTDTWYHWDMSLTRRADGGVDYVLDIRRLSDNFSLDGPISFDGAPGAGRPWLTGVGFDGSSNPDETILIDNLSITPEPATAMLVLAGMAITVRRRRR